MTLFRRLRLSRIVRIGLLDSGVGPELRERVLGRSRFEFDRDGGVAECCPSAERNGHGSSLAKIIVVLVPAAGFLDAQVFDARGVSSPAVVAAGLDWLIRNDAHLVNMSFGLLEDRAVLRQACERARAAGIVMFAATPARGPRVFPAAYPGVIRICGDGRCGPREISVLGGTPADFGACPFPPEQCTQARAAGGASNAVAHATGIAGAWMARRRGAQAGEIFSYLSSIACYFTGPARTGAGADGAAQARR